jgi:AICAR transformylase/IMP cyclohydrolase PurH
LQMVKSRYGENPHQKDSSLVILTPCLKTTRKRIIIQ